MLAGGDYTYTGDNLFFWRRRLWTPVQWNTDRRGYAIKWAHEVPSRKIQELL